jgi:transcription initiation factor TFIID TATA-box-binding protein
MVDLKIENVIAATEFNMELDLLKIAGDIKDAEYDPDHFPGLIYKLRSPKTVTLMFAKGYTVCTGAKSIQNAKAALTIIFKKLIDQKLITIEKMPTIMIQNLIVSYKYKENLDLESITKKLPPDDFEYNPKNFPGIIYHEKTTEISALIFKTGVIVGYGSPHIVEMDNVLERLEKYYT